MTRFFLPILALLFTGLTPLPAQHDDSKFGKISAEDLAARTYAADTAANAVVISDYGTVTFFYKEADLYQRMVRHRVVKLLRRAAFDSESAVGIPYYTKTERITSIKAQVIAPDGTVTEVPDKDFFREKATDMYSQLRFTFPNLTEGCIIEYKYTLENSEIFTLPDWYFQTDIPVRYSALQVEIPQFLDYVKIGQGPPAKAEDLGVADKAMEGVDGTLSVKFYTFRYSMSDLPGLREEPFITTMNDYYARLRFQLSSIAYPNQPGRKVMTTWPDVASELYGHPKFGDQFEQKRHYGAAWQAVQPALEAATTPADRVKALYRFVNSSFELEEGPGIVVRRDLEDLFEQKRARGHEMNLLLVGLLRKAGFKAYPVLVSTRDHGQPIPLYPVLDQFDYVIAAVDGPDGQRQLLDAANRHRPPGLLAVRTLNGQAWLADPKKPEWLELAPPLSQDVYIGHFTLHADGGLTGSMQVIADGYSAVDRRAQLADERETQKFWKRTFEKRFSDPVLDSCAVTDADDTGKSLSETMRVTIPGFAQVANDFMYIEPILLSGYRDNPFKVEHRDYPVDMPFPVKERHVLSFEVPPGYRVEALPEPVRLVLPNNGGRFQYIADNKDNKIQLTCTLHLTQLRFAPEEYDGLRSFFIHIGSKLGEQIVLKKID